MIPEWNDPTRAGFNPPTTGAVQLSCNEVEALCLKAARGAGLSWGLAEEAGLAARWLYSRGIDGPGALLAHLDRVGERSSQIVLVDGELRAEDKGLLCPIAVGVALSDFVAAGRDCVRAERVVRPLLVLPFVHQIARVSIGPVSLYWPGGRVLVSAAGEIAGDLAALVAADMSEVAIAPVTGVFQPTSDPNGVAATATDTLTRLDAYAMLTTVPASAASRTDAGSADGDNN